MRGLLTPMNVELLLSGSQGDPDAEYLAAILAYSPLAFYDASISDIWEDSAGITPAADDADVVGRWDDLSGNDHHLSQGTTANKPTLRLAVQNNLPIVRNDIISDFLQTAIITFNQPAHYIIVYKHRTIGTPGASDIVLDGRNAVVALVVDDRPLTQITAGGVASAALIPANGVFAIVSALFNGASSALFENGVSKITGNVSTNNPSGLTLGALFDGTRSTAIDVAAVVAFDSALSDVDREAVEALLNARWAVY